MPGKKYIVIQNFEIYKIQAHSTVDKIKIMNVPRKYFVFSLSCEAGKFFSNIYHLLMCSIVHCYHVYCSSNNITTKIKFMHRTLLEDDTIHLHFMSKS